jgi:hypothetical protein
MTGFQSPQLLSDLYRDLRDRRLLPLVLVLAVGLAVVPMALSSKPSAPAPSPAVPVVQKTNAPSTQVVVSNPGVRDYRRRLREDTPKDPFVSPFPSAPLAAVGGQVTPTTGGSSSTVSTGAVSSASSSDTASTISSVPGGNSFGAPVTTHSDTESKVVFYRLKLRTGQVGGTMKVQDQVGPLSPLPSQSVPALGFLGATMDSDLNPKRAYFLVSNSVSLITGDAACVFGNPCQMLALKPDQYADLTWNDGLNYRVKLLKFERHVRDNPPSQLGDNSN